MADEQKLSDLTAHLKEYVDTNIKIVRLEASSRVATVSSQAISILIIALIINLFVLFVSIGLGFFLGSLWGSTYLGFFAMAGFYLLLSMTLYLTRKKWMIDPIRTAMLDILIDEEDSDKPPFN